MKDYQMGKNQFEHTDKPALKLTFYIGNIQRFLGLGILLLALGLLFNACGKDKTKGMGCECYSLDKPSTAVAEATLTVSPSHLEDTYSTYESTGQFIADGACHAVMSLDFRWADDALAKTNVRPPLTYEFQSVFGYFPTNTGMEFTTTSDEGIREYHITISEADDKSTPDGTSYGVWVKYLEDYTTQDGAITCRVDIIYNVYNASYWEEGCDL